MPKPLKGQGLAYFRQLNRLVIELKRAVKEQVLSVLKARKSEFVSDGIGIDIITILAQMKQRYSQENVGIRANNIAVPAVNQVVGSNQRKFEKLVSNTVGVDIAGILTGEGLTDFVETQVVKNSTLITNMTSEYLKEVETVIINGVNSGLRYEEIAKQIQARTGSAGSKLTNKARLIARNEVANINSQLTKRRSEDLGIKEFIWSTSDDERVRGDPGGLYPDAKPSHFRLDGKRFSWKDGAKTINGSIWPGSEINCRCVAINVISP